MGRIEAGKIPETEQDFKSWVIDLAHTFGWKCAHFRPGQTEKGWRTPVEADGGGFPDLVLVKPPKCLFAELKSEKGKLSGNQERWLRELSSCPGIAVCIWRPGDRDTIIEILR